MSNFESLKGTWIHPLPWDSDDYLAEYTISGDENNPIVSAVDSNDGEPFEISEVAWSNGILTFKSLMPSTQREGTNEFSINSSCTLNSKFTFTVYESLHKKNT